MTLMERVADAGSSLIVTAIVSVGGGIVWLVRRIFTNQQQIEMLSAEIKHRDELRQMDRTDITEVKNSVKRIEGWIMERDK